MHSDQMRKYGMLTRVCFEMKQFHSRLVLSHARRVFKTMALLLFAITTGQRRGQGKYLLTYTFIINIKRAKIYCYDCYQQNPNKCIVQVDIQ